jgi:hypothetical protein
LIRENRNRSRIRSEKWGYTKHTKRKRFKKIKIHHRALPLHSGFSSSTSILSETPDRPILERCLIIETELEVEFEIVIFFELETVPVRRNRSFTERFVFVKVDSAGGEGYRLFVVVGENDGRLSNSVLDADTSVSVSVSVSSFDFDFDCRLESESGSQSDSEPDPSSSSELVEKGSISHCAGTRCVLALVILLCTEDVGEIDPRQRGGESVVLFSSLPCLEEELAAAMSTDVLSSKFGSSRLDLVTSEFIRLEDSAPVPEIDLPISERGKRTS